MCSSNGDMANLHEVGTPEVAEPGFFSPLTWVNRVLHTLFSPEFKRLENLPEFFSTLTAQLWWDLQAT